MQNCTFVVETKERTRNATLVLIIQLPDCNFNYNYRVCKDNANPRPPLLKYQKGNAYVRVFIPVRP